MYANMKKLNGKASKGNLACPKLLDYMLFHSYLYLHIVVMIVCG